MRLDVAVAPAFLDADALRECACAVVDVLRATSTITVAMAGGAAAVHPCLSIEEARTRAGASSEKGVLLGGEERGQRIPGFNLGNSPLEYLDPDTVGGRDIFFYTTNGTGTIRRAYAACGRPVHIAALINASAAASALAAAASASDAEGVVIACSGRYGRPSAEDILCAGLVVERVHDIMRSAGLSPEWTDGASIAAGFAASNRRNVLDVLASSEHGRFLRTIGFEEDLEFTSKLDTYEVVPVFDGGRVVCLT
jgi:2-phosphosulfolactate phosphatase